MEPFAPQPWEMPPGARVLEESASVALRPFDGERLNWKVAPVEVPVRLTNNRRNSMPITQVAEPNIEQDQRRINAELARRINRETRANPNSPYAGKYVAIAHGQVVAVVDTLEGITDSLDALGIDYKESGYIEASANYDEPMWAPAQMELR